MKRANLRTAAIVLLVVAAGGGAASPFAQTSLTMADPRAISKIVNNKAEIERCIITGSPESLARAKDGLIQSKVVSEDDKNALLEIVRGISTLLYPSSPVPNGLKSPVSSRGKGGEAAPGFFVEKSFGTIQPLYSLCLTQLMEASQGRVFAAPKGSEGAFLSEVLPSLAIFKTKDRETARSALGYVERFETSGSYVSAIPGLVRARYARLMDDPVQAYVSYKKTLDAYPDVWPARLELGLLSLELNQPVNALSYLAPLAGSRGNDPSVAIPYAIALYRNGKFAEAEPLARKGLEYDPESADMMLIVAHIMLRKNDYAGVQPLLDAFGKRKPADRMYLYLKADFARGLNRNDEALKWARKALQLYPADPEIMVQLAGILFAGPETGHAEAVALCNEAKKIFAANPEKKGSAGGPPPSPLQIAMCEEAEGEAARFLMLEAYNNQDWYAASAMLESTSTAKLDKAVVATILRKSGNIKGALAFSSEWYRNSPQSEEAAEAYLRSLAAAGTGKGIASAAQPGSSDIPSGWIGMLGGSPAGTVSPAQEQGQGSLVGLALQLLSGSYSASMRSYLYYLRGTLQSDPDAAIDSYRLSLLERADNVEALAALAKAYARKNDAQKALSYIRQARSIGIVDADLAAELRKLETTLAPG